MVGEAWAKHNRLNLRVQDQCNECVFEARHDCQVVYELVFSTAVRSHVSFEGDAVGVWNIIDEQHFERWPLVAPGHRFTAFLSAFDAFCTLADGNHRHVVGDWLNYGECRLIALCNDEFANF